MNKTVLLECIECRLKISVSTIGNSGAVVLGQLSSDRSQLETCNPGMVFQQPEEVAAFNGSMLPGVTDKQYPVVVLIGEPDNFCAFTQRIQSAFVDDHVTARFRFLFRKQKACDGT